MGMHDEKSWRGGKALGDCGVFYGFMWVWVWKEVQCLRGLEMLEGFVGIGRDV